MGNVGELEALRIRLESLRQIRKKKILDNFRVHEQYGRIEQDANQPDKRNSREGQSAD